MRASTITLAVLTVLAVQTTSSPATAQAEPTAATAAPAEPAAAKAAGAKPAPVKSGGETVAIDVEFMESSGVTLAERHARLALGQTETISVQQGNRSVSLETTIRAGAKAGCHKIDVTLRDRRIDATGHFAKTVWQSTTEPCTPTPFVLGPKEETRVKVALKPGT
jgi:hypothetical protein